MAFSWSGKAQSWHSKRHKESPVAVPPPPFGDVIQTLAVDNVAGEAKGLKDLAHISNTRTVTSYSWVDKYSSGPNIQIPAKPPRWTPQAYPLPLKEDNGTYFRDKNAARYPDHPTEPAVVAALAADPIIPTEVDIFACGSTVGNLLRFVRGQDRTFRMLAYKINNTVFLVRRENSPTELIPDVRGYGHAFPNANTTWEADVKGSASHQRLIRYTFGGLDMVVRFEADGYIPPPSCCNKDLLAPSPVTPPSVADLSSLLSTTIVSPPALLGSPTESTKSTLTVTLAGTLIPQSTLFDLKTRSIYTRDKKDHLAEELPRLWVSQIPTLILAFHTRGLFKKEDIQIKDVREDVKKWEREHQDELARLAAVLGWIRRVVGEQDEGKLEICRTVGDGELEVRRQVGDVGEMLSDGVRERWESLALDEKKEVEGKDEAGEGVEDKRENWKWEEDADEDFTACGDSCGYCGRCTY